MSLRVLFGILGWMLEERNASENVNLSEKAQGEYVTINTDFQSPAKFHIGMLTISLLGGLGYGGFIAFTCWKEKDIFLGYIRNLVIALTCRTFFSILFDGVILLGSPLSVGGGNTLLSFEQILLNLVLAFWLSLTVYMHARVQRNFNSEPTLRLYQYGIPGVAVFFAFIWIFTLQDQLPSVSWWIILNPLTQWIVNSLNLLFVLLQLGLVIDIGRMIRTKTSLDQDSSSLMWKAAGVLGILVFIIWLHFGMILGRLPLRNSQGYLYFFYLIDGLECAIVCACMFFFYKWVQTLLKSLQSLIHGTEEAQIWTTKSSNEALIPQNEGIFTLDRMFINGERNGKWKNKAEDDDTKDVVYSNVVEPDRLKKTLDLYKRLNAIPKQEVTVVEGEEFYDCRISTPIESREMSQEQKDLMFKRKVSSVFEEIKFKNDQIQKKNAFYSSKYLILDTKEGDFPKYLETRPSISSASEKGSPKEEQRLDFPPDSNMLESGEMVRKWLTDYSDDMQIYDEPRKRTSIRQKQQEEASSKNSELKLSKDKFRSDIKTDTRATDQHSESPSKSVVLDKEKNEIAIADEVINSGVDKKQLDSHTHDMMKTNEQKTQVVEKVKPEVRRHGKLPSQPMDNLPEIETSGEIKQKTQVVEKINSDVENKCEEANATAKSTHLSNKETPDQDGSNQSLMNLNSEPEENKYKVQGENIVTPVENSDTKTTPKQLPSQIITYSELQNFRLKNDSFKADRESVTSNNFSLQGSIFARINSLINTGFPILKGNNLQKPETAVEIKQDIRPPERLPRQPTDILPKTEIPEKIKQDVRPPEGLPIQPTNILPKTETPAQINQDFRPETLPIQPMDILPKTETPAQINQDFRHEALPIQPMDILPKTEISEQVKKDVRAYEGPPKEAFDDSNSKYREKMIKDFPGKEQTMKHGAVSSPEDHFTIYQEQSNLLSETKKTNQRPEEHNLQLSDYNRLINKSHEGQPDELLKPATKLQRTSPFKNSNMNLHDTSSESEFSIERRKSSSSDSFSIEQYYSEVLKKRDQFNNKQKHFHGK